MAVLLIGTLDTKGIEIGFVRDLLRAEGLETIVMDAGTAGPPAIAPDVPRERVLEAAGSSLVKIAQHGDRGEAVTLAAQGVRKLALELHSAGKVDGVLSLGGSAGTTIGTSAMRALPFGLPKLMVSTLASGQVRPFVGPRDILMMHSVTDISGVNRLSRMILTNAANAMAGMVRRPPVVRTDDKPLWTATMFGVTTTCVEACRQLAEAGGREVLVFHAVGTGGEAMESLIADGLIEGVLDLTTTELADELVGGVLTAGPDRLTAAARRGVPQVVSVGAMDMVNFGPRASVPRQFDARKFHIHNENVTLMRTTPEENQKLGEQVARKVSASTGPAAILLPLQGVSAIDAPGKPFYDPLADRMLFRAIRDNAASNVQLIELDCHINDPMFAEAAVQTLRQLVANKAGAR